MPTMVDLSCKQMSLCGIRLDALTHLDLLASIEQARFTRQRFLGLNHNLHSLYLYVTDPAFRKVYEDASCVYVDGIPVVWLGRAAGLPLSNEHRITFLDSFEAILARAAERGWRIFYLGSTEATLTAGLAKISANHPHLIIAGRNGYLGEHFEDAPEAIAEINAFRPDLLFIGMGMPRQEAFLGRYLQDIHVPAILTSGATLDYITGAAYKPPAWAGPLGLYGVFRLFSDPRRLWKRYLIEPLLLLRHLGIPIVQQRIRALQQKS